MSRTLQEILIPAGAIVVALLLFGIFVTIAGYDPVQFYQLIWVGAFGSWFSWQNTLQRAAPLLLTALTTALPAQLGLVVIGGEGAMALGGLAAVAAGLALATAPNAISLLGMALAGIVVGGGWITIAGALRHYRGVNETISSLLLSYIAIAVFNHLVEGPMRDPTSLNKPSTFPIPESHMLSTIPGMDVHWGLAVGLIACLLAYVLIYHTVFGFSSRMVGGNPRAARIAGLSVGRLVLISCFLGGAAAGLAGMIEVAAVHGRANASLIAGYGYTGILIAFIGRQNPLGVIPGAILLGGIAASGGLLQRRLDMPDSTVLVLQGVIFMTILASETMFGRRFTLLSFLRPRTA
jgi:simple sugar transport system permease protein